MTITINGSGPIVGSDRAASGTNTDITALSSIASINGGQLAGMRNRIINGGMQVWQRGLSSLVSTGYGADRWRFGFTGTAPTVLQQSTGIGQFQYCMVTAGIAGNTLVQYWHRIESQNILDLAGKQVTLTAKVYCISTVTLTINIDSANTADNYSGITNIATTTIVLNAGWNNIDWTTSALASSVTKGIQIVFAVQAGLAAGNQFGLTGVQLELGSVATPFEQRPYGLELMLCKRYYETIGAGHTSTAGNTTTFEGVVRFDVQKRTTPTGALLGGSISFVQSGISVFTANTPGFQLISPSVFAARVDLSGFTGLTAGRTGYCTNDFASINSEL